MRGVGDIDICNDRVRQEPRCGECRPALEADVGDNEEMPSSEEQIGVCTRAMSEREGASFDKRSADALQRDEQGLVVRSMRDEHVITSYDRALRFVGGCS